MMKEEFLKRARRSLRLARIHHNLRDVSAEVTDVREALAAAGSQPAAIGITELELVGLVRGGYMAEARITFDLAVDGAASEFEKEFFFTELVALITKATLAVPPARPTVREEPLTAEPATDLPLVETDIETLKAEKERYAGRIRILEQWIAKIRAETDRKTAEYLVQTDPFILNERSGAHDLKAILGGVPDEAIASIDFSRFENVSTFDVARPAVPVPDDDPDPVIELSTIDMDACPEFEIIEENPEYEHYAIGFFGEKDAIALGFIPAPTASLIAPEERRGIAPLAAPQERSETDLPASAVAPSALPPPLPKGAVGEAADDA